jgi:tetratricopeptide (TPR) repeat protein
MTAKRALLCALATAAALTLASTAAAQIPSDVDKPLSTAGYTAREISDQNEVAAALVDFSKGKYASLAPHLDPLREVLNHAPGRFPKVEIRGALTLIRADGAEFDALAQTAKANGATQVVQAFNIYIWAAFLLGSNANEVKHFDEGIGYVEHGLAFQPNDSLLLAERGYALNQTHRPADALAAYQAALRGSNLENGRRATLLRGVGFAYIDLNRLDDAQKAYEDSLKFDPASEIAQRELKYIADHRTGGSR